MSSEASRAYAATDVRTASPERLRLMLIEAAIGYAGEARRHAQASSWAIAGEAFVESRRAVIDLLAGIRTDVQSGDANAASLARKVRSLYTFLLRHLTEAQLYRDPERINETLRLLQMERETWRQVCERAAHHNIRDQLHIPKEIESLSIQA
jgi:flagellar secretion chaperone FliS